MSDTGHTPAQALKSFSEMATSTLMASVDKRDAEIERLRKALVAIIERSNNHELGTGKVPDMRTIAEAALIKEASND